MKTYSTKYLMSLNTNRLLAYYKTERSRFISYRNNQPHDLVGYINSESETKIQEWEDYLEGIRTILNSREHVPQKHHKGT